MSTANGWEVKTDTLGKRRAFLTTSAGERLMLLESDDGKALVLQRLRAGKLAFARLGTAPLTDAELVSIEFRECVAIPRDILAALLE